MTRARRRRRRREATRAARLELDSRAYGTPVLVGKGPARACGDRYLFREVDRVRMRGESLPVLLFELIGRREGDARPESVALFEREFLAYHQRRFPGALEILTRCVEEFQDSVSGRYGSNAMIFRRSSSKHDTASGFRSKYSSQNPSRPQLAGASDRHPGLGDVTTYVLGMAGLTISNISSSNSAGVGSSPTMRNQACPGSIQMLNT